jgi:hypothetical protein
MPGDDPGLELAGERLRLSIDHLIEGLQNHAIVCRPGFRSRIASGVGIIPTPQFRLSRSSSLPSGPSQAARRKARLGDAPVWEDVMMQLWTEFKNTLLPWLLAAGVVAFLISEHRRTTQALLEANARLAAAVEQQGKALDGVRELLSAQGYTLPPLDAPQ